MGLQMTTGPLFGGFSATLVSHGGELQGNGVNDSRQIEFCFRTVHFAPLNAGGLK
jgi:hypothetical protein